jgi:hypothetical protein
MIGEAVLAVVLVLMLDGLLLWNAQKKKRNGDHIRSERVRDMLPEDWNKEEE